MFIKLLDGIDAGKIRDIQNEAAVELLKQHRAVQPFADEGNTEPRARIATKLAQAKNVPRSRNTVIFNDLGRI
jgi:hypothetical protein